MNRDRAAEDDILVHRFGSFTYPGMWLILAGMTSGLLITAAAVVQGTQNGRNPFILTILFVGMCNFMVQTVRAIDRIRRVHAAVSREVEAQRKTAKEVESMVNLGPLAPHPVDDPDSIFFHENFMPYCICPGCHVEALHWMRDAYSYNYDSWPRYATYDVLRTCRECQRQWPQNVIAGHLHEPLQGPALPTKDEYPIGSEPKDITIPWEQYVQADKDRILAEAALPPPDIGYSWATSEGIWHDQPIGPRRNREN